LQLDCGAAILPMEDCRDGRFACASPLDRRTRASCSSMSVAIAADCGAQRGVAKHGSSRPPR
jgi:hypothetical protein